MAVRPIIRAGAATVGQLPAVAALGSLEFVTNPAGSHEYGQLTQLPAGFGAGEFTLEMWLRLDHTIGTGDTSQGGEAQRTLWSSNDVEPYSDPDWWFAGNFLQDGHNNGGGVENGTCSLQVYGSGRLRWLFGDGAAAGARVGDMHAIQAYPASSTPTLLDAAWKKASLVRRWDGGTGALLDLWINGTLIAQETTSARTDMTTFWNTWSGYGAGVQQGWMFGAEKFAVAGGGTFEDYKGLVSELTFWNRAKSASELASDWNRPTEEGEPGLVGMYRFLEQSGASAADALASGGAIALNNGVLWNAAKPFA